MSIIAAEIDYEQKEFQRNPWEVYAHLRQNAPVFWSEKNRCYYISKFNLVKQILNDQQRFTAEHAFRATRHLFGPTMIDLDGERHQSFRKIFAEKFKQSHINAISERIIRAVVVKTMHELSGSTQIDVVSDIASVVPIKIILEIIGLPANDSRWVFEKLRPVMRYLGYSKNGMTEALNASEELRMYTHEILKSKRVYPKDSILASLPLNTRNERLTAEDLIRHVLLLLSAGTETTMGTLSNLFVCLLRYPKILQQVQNNHQLIAPAIRETLRYEPPLHNTLRIAKETVEIEGVTIPQNSAVQLLLASANRDEDVYVNPNQWDISRKEKHNLSFGAGPHNCLGFLLANKELEIMVEELFRHFEIFGNKAGGIPIIKGGSFRYADQVLLHVESRRVIYD